MPNFTAISTQIELTHIFKTMLPIALGLFGLMTLWSIIWSYRLHHHWHLAIRRSLAHLVLAFAISLIGFQIWQTNIFNIAGTTQKQLQHYHYQKLQRTHTIYAFTARQRIAKMVMRNAANGYHKQGFVAIPTRSILLPIYDDAYSVAGLNQGANYANRSADDPNGTNMPVMGQGNYGLAAHNFNDGHTGFSALQKNRSQNAPYLQNGQPGSSDWLQGQKVYLANGTHIYTYTITGQDLVKPSDVSVLNATKHAKLTIISCLFPDTNYRIITHATLTQSATWANASDRTVGYFDLTNQATNAHAAWFNPGTEEGVNGDAGGTK